MPKAYRHVECQTASCGMLRVAVSPGLDGERERQRARNLLSSMNVDDEVYVAGCRGCNSPQDGCRRSTSRWARYDRSAAHPVSRVSTANGARLSPVYTWRDPGTSSGHFGCASCLDQSGCQSRGLVSGTHPKKTCNPQVYLHRSSTESCPRFCPFHSGTLIRA